MSFVNSASFSVSLTSFSLRWEVALKGWVVRSLPFHRDFALCKQSEPGVCSPDISLLFRCILFMALTATSLVAPDEVGWGEGLDEVGLL